MVMASDLPRVSFVVQVSDLVDRPGAQRHSLLSGRIVLDFDQVKECGSVRADLILQGMMGGVLARGNATASLRLRCNRCLEGLSFEAAVTFVQHYGAEADADIVPVTPDGAIDLYGVLHDELCLSVPLVPLCSEDCQGLCSTCGTDLNADPCEGHVETRGSPFALLEDWLETPSAGR